MLAYFWGENMRMTKSNVRSIATTRKIKLLAQTHSV